jgi:citrate lyase subunit beta/citryl-CoA lyase
MSAPRPRRSVLFVPGDKPRALAKAQGLKADAVIFDLEDSVAPDAKAAAREGVAAALAPGYGRRETVLRVNAPGTPWHGDDLAFAATLAIDAVLLPKVESGDDVRAADAALAAAGAPPGLGLWCMMETPRAFLASAAIASSSPRLAALVIGTEDLAKDLRARSMPGRAPFVTALGLGLLAARAHGLAALDAVYRNLNDAEGFAAECRQGRDLGFDGKTIIHPNQIEGANAAFAPSAAELDEARRIIAAFATAAAAGQGVATLDGRLIERLHAGAAERVLDLAAAIAALEEG